MWGTVGMGRRRRVLGWGGMVGYCLMVIMAGARTQCTQPSEVTNMSHHSVAAGNIGKSKWSPRLSDETESSCCMTLRGRHRCRHREGWRGGGGYTFQIRMAENT